MIAEMQSSIFRWRPQTPHCRERWFESHNTYTQNEIQLKLNSFSQQAHGLTRRLGNLLRLVSKLPSSYPRKWFQKKFLPAVLQKKNHGGSWRCNCQSSIASVWSCIDSRRKVPIFLLKLVKLFSGYGVYYCIFSCYSIQLSPEGEVNSGGYIPRREASRYISTALHRPWGG